MRQSITVSKKVLSGTFTCKDSVVLSYEIAYPRFASQKFCQAAENMNAYYAARAKKYECFVRTTLKKEAIQEYLNSIQNAYPVREYAADETFKVTYNQNCALSLYIDRYEYRGGAHGTTLREADTWNLLTGRKISLKALFPDNPNYMREIKAAIIQQIKRQNEQGDGYYFENYATLVKETFQAENFYLKSDAIVIFFQQYDIAPYAAGIPTFEIPFESLGAKRPQCE